MDKKDLDRLESKVDKLDTRLDRIDVTLAAQHVTLEEHTRRSLANEKAVETIAKELKPIQTHVAIVGLVGKVLLALGTSEVFYYLIKVLK